MNKIKEKLFMKIKWMNRLIKFLFPSVVVSLMFTSCYNDYGLNTSDFDIAATFRNNNIDFQNYSTYAMPDSIGRLPDTDPADINTMYDELILTQVAAEMEAYGYTRITAGPNSVPDVVLLVGATSSDKYAYDPGYWYPIWGWWPGWGYYPGYGPGWGYYPPYYGGVVYSYSTGTVLITMLDANSYDPDKKEITAAWSGALNGLLEGSTSTRITNGINKLFQQSPYLKIN